MIIRKARVEDAPACTQIHIATWQATYRGVVPDDFLDAMPSRFAQRLQFWEGLLNNPEQITYVAEDEEQGVIAGFVNGAPSRHDDPDYPKELQMIYILPAYQQMGLGRKLMSTLAQAFLAEGTTTMWLWVLEGNESGILFYERLGGKYKKNSLWEVSGVKLPERAYVWDDIRPLIAQSDPLI